MQQNSFGWSMTIETGLDLTLATHVIITVQRPDGTHFNRSIDMLNDVIDAQKGTISYHVLEKDLSKPGVYEIQVCDTTQGRCLLSQVAKFEVKPSIHIHNKIHTHQT